MSDYEKTLLVLLATGVPSIPAGFHANPSQAQSFENGSTSEMKPLSDTELRDVTAKGFRKRTVETFQDLENINSRSRFRQLIDRFRDGSLATRASNIDWKQHMRNFMEYSPFTEAPGVEPIRNFLDKLRIGTLESDKTLSELLKNLFEKIRLKNNRDG